MTLRALSVSIGVLFSCCWLQPVSAASLPDTVQRIKPSIVVVGTWQRTRSPAFIALGTGFAVGDGKFIATNAHVKLRQINSEQLETMVIVVPGQERLPREVERVIVDDQHDLALLRIKEGAALPALSLASNAAREGQGVALMGFPLGNVLGFTPAVQAGTIAAIAPLSIPAPRADRLDSAAIRQLAAGAYPIYVLDAVARPGNSGSPVFDAESGQVIGIVSAGMVRRAREPGLGEPTGITYAIPIEHLQRLMRDAH